MANSFVDGPPLRVLSEKLRHRCGFDESHLFVWTPDDLAKMVEKNGFHIRKTALSSVTASFYINAQRT